MNIKGVVFPPALLDALRDEKLVVFAGVGVLPCPHLPIPAPSPVIFAKAGIHCQR
ncbi:MAG: hypothetical protein OXI08_04635 [Cyanobacteria bacterium MAG IRC4_bin_6]|nr:hypothetical protein [Cyanobacteria bacterium MAG IRC4_bin_6]